MMSTAAGPPTPQLSSLGKVPCPVCGEFEIETKLFIANVSIRQCRSCELQFWQPQEFHFLDNLYSQQYFQGESSAGYNDYFSLEAGLRRTFQKRLDLILQHRQGAQRLLELGSGPGYFLSEAEKRGLKATGVEISEYAADFGREQLHVDLRSGGLDDHTFSSEMFDVFCMWDVIEHLTDPRHLLLKAHTLLRPGGMLWLTTGDCSSFAARASGSKWHLYTIPEHLFFFCPKNIRLLLEQCGFRIVHLTHPPVYVPLRYISERLKKTLNLQIPFFSTSHVVVPMNLFDIMMVGSVRI